MILTTSKMRSYVSKSRTSAQIEECPGFQEIGLWSAAGCDTEMSTIIVVRSHSQQNERQKKRIEMLINARRY